MLLDKVERLLVGLHDVHAALDVGALGRPVVVEVDVLERVDVDAQAAPDARLVERLGHVRRERAGGEGMGGVGVVRDDAAVEGDDVLARLVDQPEVGEGVVDGLEGAPRRGDKADAALARRGDRPADALGDAMVVVEQGLVEVAGDELVHGTSQPRVLLGNSTPSAPHIVSGTRPNGLGRRNCGIVRMMRPPGA